MPTLVVAGRSLTTDEKRTNCVPCPRCGAGVGSWCATESGRAASVQHAERREAAIRAGFLSDGKCRRCRRLPAEFSGDLCEPCWEVGRDEPPDDRVGNEVEDDADGWA